MTEAPAHPWARDDFDAFKASFDEVYPFYCCEAALSAADTP